MALINYLRLSAFVMTLPVVYSCALPGAQGCHPGVVECREPASRVDALDQPTLGIVSFRPDHLIATDLVNALTQLRPYNVSSTLIKVPDSGSAFSKELENVLIARGYDLEKSDRRYGKGVLMASVVKSPQESWRYTYMIAIDRVAMKRDYYIGEDKVVAPVTSLYVRGAAPDMIQLNDGLFLK